MKTKLFRIPKEFEELFEEAQAHDISDFHAVSMRLVGCELRPKSSQDFWVDDRYCWFTDETQSHVQCLWQTKNGILMFEDETLGELYRVDFNN